MSDFLNCPKCGETGLRCTDSRPTDNNTKIRRRRRCDKCEHRYSTVEILADDYQRYLELKKIENRLRALCRNTINEIDRWRRNDEAPPVLDEPQPNGEARATQ